jgi:alpha-1,6-mannosyltransferase
VQRSGALSSRNLTVAFAVVGFLLVAIVAATPGSPLQPVLPPGAGPSGPFRWLSGALGVDALHGNALAVESIVAVTVAAASFLCVLRAAWRRDLSVRLVAGIAIAFHLGILFLPLLVSRDVYSYAIYGRIASVYHANPYVVTPIHARADPVFAYIGPKWADTPAVYGPGFTLFSAGLTRWIASLPALIRAFQLVAAAASLGTVAIAAWLARRLRPDRAAFAVAIVGMNPVVLFQSVASGHNDVLIMFAVAAALALVFVDRTVLATVMLTVGMLVKATAAIPLLFLLVLVVARAEPGRRMRLFLVHAVPSGVLVLLSAAPFLQSKDPTLGLLELAGHEGWLAPSRFFRRIVEGIGSTIGLDAVGSVLALAVRIGFALTLVASMALIAREVWRRGRGGLLRTDGTGAAWGWALLLLMLLGPVLLPWYVTWALPLAWLLPRVPRTVLIGVSTALTLSQWATEPVRFPGAYEANILFGHYVITPIVAGLLVWLLVDLRRRLREGSPLEDEPREVPATAG